MGNGLRALVLVGLSASSMIADAAAVVVGDKEWQQPSEWTNFTWINFVNVCSQTTGECAGSLGGRDLTGWIWASNLDVMGLFNALIPRDPVALSNEFDGYAETGVYPSDFLAAMSAGMFNPTSIVLGASDDSYSLHGWTRTWYSQGSVSAGSTPYLAANVNRAPPGNHAGVASLGSGWNLQLAEDWIGAWLYRPYVTTVPEPGTLALFGLGLAGLGLSRRRRAD